MLIIEQPDRRSHYRADINCSNFAATVAKSLPVA